MTLNAYRVIGGVLLLALLVAAGNYYLEWGLFGGAAKRVMSGALCLITLFAALMPARFQREMQARREEVLKSQLEAEREWERNRDKANDEAESDSLRRAIGLPPDKSLERTREG